MGGCLPVLDQSMQWVIWVEIESATPGSPGQPHLVWAVLPNEDQFSLVNKGSESFGFVVLHILETRKSVARTGKNSLLQIEFVFSSFGNYELLWTFAAQVPAVLQF